MQVKKFLLSAVLLLQAAHVVAAPDLPVYSVTDLKALGIWPAAMNQKGQVVGHACCGRQSAGVQFYASAEVRDLGLPAGGYANFSPVAINDSGWIVGNARKPSLPGPNNEQFSDAALYDGGGWTVIDTSSLGHPTHVSGINNAGQVIGNTEHWPVLTRTPWLYEHGLVVQLTQASDSAASDISEGGQVVGSDGPYFATGVLWAYRGGQLNDLAVGGSAPLVNEAGNILAAVRGGAGIRSTAILVLDGKQYYFPKDGCSPPNVNADYFAMALNERGDVAGYRTVACLYNSSSGTSVGLGTLGGDRSVAQSLNNRGQVAGWSLDTQGRYRPFVYDDGVMLDVADLRGVGAALQFGNADAIRVTINDGPYLLITAANTLAEPDTLEAAYLLTPIAPTLPPTLTLTASPTQAPVRTSVTLTWSSQNANNCVATGGVTGDGWAGARPASGQATVTATVAGSAQYAMRCTAFPLSADAQVSVLYDPAPPTVRLSATPSKTEVRTQVTLAWTAEGADSCVATGGRPGDAWTGTLPTSGQQAVSETQSGTVQYGVRCTAGTLPSEAQVSVTYTKKSGGGGHVDVLAVLSLVGLGLGLGRRRKAA